LHYFVAFAVVLRSYDIKSNLLSVSLT